MNESDWNLLENKMPLKEIEIDGFAVKIGDRVRLKPKARGDIFDIVLRGKIGTVESIEQDYEDRIYLAIVIEDDPGKDLGYSRRIGHRFFFSAEEIEPLMPKKFNGDYLK